MKIKILGSSGGESFPASFCCCEHCEMARQAGGKSLRSLSQTLIDDDLLIDFPTDTDDHCRRFGINLGKIKNCNFNARTCCNVAFKFKYCDVCNWFNTYVFGWFLCFNWWS